MRLHEDLPEHSVRHCAPSATSITLNPALHLLMPPPPHLTATLLTQALQPLPPLPQVHPVLTGRAFLPMIPVLTLCFLIGCPCFALAAGSSSSCGTKTNAACSCSLLSIISTAQHACIMAHGTACITPLSRHKMAQHSLPYSLCNFLTDRQTVTSLMGHIVN